MRLDAATPRQHLFAAMLGLIAFLTPLPGVAGSETGAKIRQALQDWTQDFNVGNAARICDLFAPDLRYDYRGFPERGYAEICSTLQRSLKDRSKRYSYALDIKEILVAGDLAIVRLVWTLTITENGSKTQTREPGMDLFQRQPDGTWKIIRYIAYES